MAALQRCLSKNYSSLVLICCTFIITYTFMKETCNTPNSKLVPYHNSYGSNHNTLEGYRNAIEENAIKQEQPQKIQAIDVINNRAESNRTKLKVASKLQKRKTHHKPSTRPPVKQIAFLKVHKAGSSTVQNILFRFGIRYNLTFVLPSRGHYVYYPKEVLPVEKGGKFNIFACHTIYRPDIFNMLQPGYKSMAIIREPLKRMVSAAYYYRDVLKKDYLMKVPRADLIHNLIKNPKVYDKSLLSRTKNSMGSDFGFSSAVRQNDTSMIKMYTNYLAEKFKLVLIMDRFDESLILMKRHYRWSLQDLVYLKSNSHGHPHVELSEQDIQRFKELSFMDYAIYNTFYPKFDKEVESLGDEFQLEVMHFRQIIIQVNQYCKHAGPGTGLEVDASEWNDAFEVTMGDCVMMKLNDLDFVVHMQRRHRAMHITKTPALNLTV